MFANRRCYQRDVEYRQRVHKQRLKNMKSLSKSKNPFQKVKMDMDPPVKPHFLKKNMSKKIHDQQRIKAIEHDNRILLKKMADIMMPRKSNRLQEFLPGVRLTPGGAPVVDNFISTTNVLPGSNVGSGRRKKKKSKHKPNPTSTLGGLARKREMERIITENLAMLDRINRSKTSYSKTRLRKEFNDSRVRKSLCSVDQTAGFLLPKGATTLPRIRAQTSPSRSRHGGGGGSGGFETTTLAFEKTTQLAMSDGSMRDHVVKIYAETSERNPLVQVTIETRPDSVADNEAQQSEDGGAATSDDEEAPLLLTITQAELKFFVPVARRQHFFARENMPELFDFLLSRLEVAELDSGEAFLHIAPCTDEERISIGMEPILVHRSVLEVPVRSMASSASPDPEGERVAMVVDTVFRGGTLKITGFDMDNHVVYECPQKVKYREEIVEQGRDSEVVSRLVPTLAIKVSSSQRGNKVLVLDTSGAKGPQSNSPPSP